MFEQQLIQLGLANTSTYRNLPVACLYEHALKNNEASLSEHGALLVNTGLHTGRAAKDKYVVDDTLTHDVIWWGSNNHPMTPEIFEGLYNRAISYCQNKKLYITDCLAGKSDKHALPVRVISEFAWHALFAHNMFVRLEHKQLAHFEPEWVVLQLPCMHAQPAKDGTSSDVFIVINFTRKIVLIGGTAYAGEAKKAIFSVLNYQLPQSGILPMHCSVNQGDDDDSAVFFGLSGTGKTTLSADPERALIGDDEHGWSDEGVFNFEGGCYAKVIRLSAKDEPEIYATTQRFGTVLENVVFDHQSRVIDMMDNHFTDNTRASYPIDYIPNALLTGQGAVPNQVIMLTADAFGVLPPVAKLSIAEAMYHFISGYTAKVAGTELGVGSEPTATFSACFGAPFMPLNPTVYAKLLGERLAKNNTQCWLVNTGWIGGAYGVGKRISIPYTRAMLRAILTGHFDNITFVREPYFNLSIPTTCPDVPDAMLSPSLLWETQEQYIRQAHHLAQQFVKNFKIYQDKMPEVVNQVNHFPILDMEIV